MNYNINRISLFLVFLISCNNSKLVSRKKNDILVTYQFINFTGTYYDSIDINKFIIINKNYTFLKIPAILTSEGKINKSDTIYSYYLFHNNYKSGYFIDSLFAKSYKPINKDSFFSKQFYFILEKINLKSESNYTFLNSYKEDKITVNKYYLKKEIDSSYCDTALLYFDDNLKGIDFSLDKRLDSIHQSKLIKKKTLYYNKIKESPYSGTVYREISVSIKFGEYQTKDEIKTLVALFDRYNTTNSNRQLP